jgi:hypothetical protein
LRIPNIRRAPFAVVASLVLSAGCSSSSNGDSSSNVQNDCCIVTPADPGSTPTCWCGTAMSSPEIGIMTTVTGSTCTVTLMDPGPDGGVEKTVATGTPPTSSQECAMDLPIGGS